MLERTKEKLSQAYVEGLSRGYNTNQKIEFLIQKCSVNKECAQCFVFNREIEGEE